MATELATAYISIVPSARGMKSHITNELGGAGTAAARRTEDAYSGAGRRAAGVFKSALIAASTAAAGALYLGGKVAWDSITNASDLGEAQSKVNAIFGAEGQAQVDAWAAKAAAGFGQSKIQATEAVGTFGNLLTSFGLGDDAALTMSQSMAGLASDLASFNNTSVEDALDALRSGLTGETEPLKRYGVALDDASLKAKAFAMVISDGKSTLTPAQKAQAAYALILERTANAQGDFARTSDGLANQQRIFAARWDNLKTTIGQALLPALNKLLPVISDLFDRIEPIAKDAIPALRGAFDKISEWFKGDGADTVATASDYFTTMKDIFGDVAVFVQENWPAISKTIGDVMGSVQRIVTAVIDIVRTFWGRWGDDIMNFAQATLPYLLDQISLVYDTVAKVVELVAALFRGDWSEAWQLSQDILQNATDFFQNMVDLAMRAVRNMFTVSMRFIVDQLKAMPGRIASASAGMWDGLKDAFKAAMNWIISKWNDLEFKLPEANFLGQKVGGFVIGTPEIPEFHSGGIYKAPPGQSEGLALLRDGERVLTPEQQMGGGVHFHGPVSLGGSPGTLMRDLTLYSRRQSQAVLRKAA